MLARNFRAILAAGTALSLAVAASPATAQLVRSGDLIDAVDSAGNGGTLAVVDTSSTQTDMVVLAPVVVANWNRFNVPQNTTVNIANGTTNPSAALVNRVIGANFSDISGSINAPDVNLWLINQNGILFGNGAAVNSASFFASSSDVADADVFDFYEGTNLAGNGSNTIDFAGVGSSAVSSSSSNVSFVTDGTLMFVGPQLNLNANFDAGSGRVSFVTASDVRVTFNPGSPLSFVVNTGTNIAEGQTVNGTIQGAGVDFAMFTATSVANAILRVDASVNATAAVPTANGIRLIAEQTGSGSVAVELNGAMSSSGVAMIGTDGDLSAAVPLTASRLSLFAGRSASFSDLTATSDEVDIDVLGGNLVAGDVRAAGNISFQAPNSASATFGSLVSTGGNVAVQGVVPGTLSVSGLTSGNVVSLLAVNALDLGDVVATSGNLLLNSVDSSVTADDVTGTGGVVNITAATTISAGAVSATTGDARLQAAGNIATASISSTAGAIDIDSTAGGALNLGTLSAATGITLDTAGSLTTSTISTGGLLNVGGTLDPNGVTFTGDAEAQSIMIDSVGGLDVQALRATGGAISLDVLGTGGNLVAGNVEATGDITFQVPNARSATFGSLVSIGGNVAVQGVVPGTLSVSGLTSGNVVSLLAVNALDLGDVVATSGNLLLNSVDSSVTADDVTGTGGVVNITAATTISAGAVSATTGDARLQAAGNIATASISSTAGAIDVDSTAGGALNLGTLSAATGITLDTTGFLTAGTVNTSELSVGSTLAPSAASFLGSVTANTFAATVSGALTFGEINQIREITGVSTGAALSLENGTDNLTISGPVTSGDNDITIRNAGDVTITASGQVDGRVVALSAGDQFINLRGSDAVAASDRWVVYSAAPAGNTFGELDSGNTAIWNGTIDTVAPGALNGNRYVFAFQPTLTITSTDLSKVYGTDLTGALEGFFTVSGLQDGVAGAYLADTLAGVLTGSPTITSAGAAANADVAGGPYEMTVSSGSLATPTGYALAFDSRGRLTITPLAITANVTADDRVYDGTTDGTGTVTLNGVLVGDELGTTGTIFTFDDKNVGTGKTVTVTGTTLTGADAGNYTLTVPASVLADILARAITASVSVDDRAYDGTTNATGTVTLDGVIAGDDIGTTGTIFTFDNANAGTDRIVIVTGTTLTGADAGNYTLTVPASALADILPRLLVITADEQEKTQGSPDPELTFEVGGQGLVAGDSLSGALAREAGEFVGNYAITQGTLDAGTNYVLEFEAGVLTIKPAPFRQVPLRAQELPGDVAAPGSETVVTVDVTGLCPETEDAACQLAK